MRVLVGQVPRDVAQEVAGPRALFANAAEDSWRIGSGETRVQSASEALLSWVAQKGAGLTVKDVRPASGPMYSGVSFDAEGNPVAPSRSEAEQRFDVESVTAPSGVTHLTFTRR